MAAFQAEMAAWDFSDLDEWLANVPEPNLPDAAGLDDELAEIMENLPPVPDLGDFEFDVGDLPELEFDDAD